MLKQSILCVCAALTLGLTLPSQADMTIGNFEQGLFGWGPTWENNVTLATSTTAATAGAQSLAVKLTTGGYWALQYNAPVVPKIVAGAKLQFDVTLIQSEWTGNNWTKVADKIALNSNGKSGWKEYFPTAVDRVTGAVAAGDWGPWSPDSLRTFSVDISDYDATGATWFQINMALQQNPATGNGNFYFDNVKLVGMDGAKIVWVAFSGTDAASTGAAGAGFTTAPDKRYTDLLAGLGFNVVRTVQTGTPDVNMVNASALVIQSRSCASGSFQNAAATTWNTKVTAPMMLMSGYTLRKSRLGFTAGETIPDTKGPIRLTASDPNHPIFAGVKLTDGVMDSNYAGLVTYPDGKTIAQGISVNTDAPNAEGKVLATVAAASSAAGPAGGMIIAEWQAGATLTHVSVTEALAGRRMVFLSGSREASGVNSETSGQFDLTADGARMFINAVAYMINPPPKPIAIELVNASFEEPNQGKIKGWNGEGIGGTPAVDVPGWASDGAPADSGVEQGWGATDGTWTAFMKAKDPMVYQTSAYVIKASDIFTLSVDARITWQATKMTLILYYDEVGMVIPMGTQDFTLTDAMTTYTMTFKASDAPDAVGKQVGVALVNSSPTADSWIGLDNVRLTVKN